MQVQIQLQFKSLFQNNFGHLNIAAIVIDIGKFKAFYIFRHVAQHINALEWRRHILIHMGDRLAIFA